MLFVLRTFSLTAEPRTDDRQRDAQTFQKHEDTENSQPCRHQECRTPAKSRATVGADDNEQRQRNRHAQTAHDKRYTVTLDNPDRTIPYSDQLTAGYERQLAPSLSASADYIHTQARDQFMLRDLNPGVRASTARTATLVRVNPAFTAQVSQPVNAGKIDYDGLEAAIVKRFAADYSFRVSYTLANRCARRSDRALSRCRRARNFYLR